MAQKTLTTSYLVKLSNANHNGVTQQILAGSYAGIQVNNSVDDDVPIFDPNTNINPWDAN